MAQRNEDEQILYFFSYFFHIFFSYGRVLMIVKIYEEYLLLTA